MDLQLFKLSMGYFSIAITFWAYLLYIASMFREVDAAGRRIEPHPLSWMLFGFLTGIGWLVQVAEGGQAGSWCLGVTAFFCFGIAGISWWKHEWRFSWDEWVWVAVGVCLFLFYLLTKASTLAVTLAVLADMAGYGPTVKKGWGNPYKDNPTVFALNSAKCIPALLALSAYSWDTSLYLWMLLVANGLVAAMLVLRRRHMDRRVL